MSQRVDYEALPGTRYDQYVPTLRRLLAQLRAPGGTDFKTFRDHLRTLGIWDKDKAEGMLSLIDLAWDRKQVTAGPLARRIMEALDDATVQELLYARLEEANVLLVKYVLEALDTASGGRLHSVHELYRMITSYVYPGDYITLPSFQAWVEWLAATGYIKLVGIRWALSEKGQEVLPRLKGMDVEEILEDLAEADGQEPEEEPAPARVAPAPAAPPAPAAAPPDEQDDLFADLPPEPEPPSAEAVARAEARFIERFEPEPEAPPGAAAAPTARPHVPLAAPPAAPAPALATAGADATELVEAATAWWRAWSGWPRFTAEALGVTVLDPAEADDDLLLRLAGMALLVEGLQPRPQVLAFARRLQAAGFFAAVGAGGLAAGLDALGDLGAEPWAAALAGRLLPLHGIARRLGEAPGALERLMGAADGPAAVRALREEVLVGAGPEAPFWVLRELLRLGVLDEARLAGAAAVPTRRLLANAWRAGLLPRREATSFDDLLAASAAVSAHFGADAGYGEALEVLDRALGLGEGEV